MEKKTKKPLWVKYKDLKARYASLKSDCAVLEKRVDGIRALRDKRDRFIQLAGLQRAYDDWCEGGIVDDYEFYKRGYKSAMDEAHQRTTQAIDYLAALVKSDKECMRLKGVLHKVKVSRNAGKPRPENARNTSRKTVK